MTAWPVGHALRRLALAGCVLLAAGCNPSAELASGPPVTPPDHPLTILYRAHLAGDALAEGRAWLNNGDPVRAAEAWAGVPDLTDADTPLLQTLADRALDAGNASLARAALETLAGRNSADYPAQLALGLLLAAAGADGAAAALQAASSGPALAAPAQDILAALTSGSAERVGWLLFAGRYWAEAELALTRAAAETGFSAGGMAELGLSRNFQGKDGEVWIGRAVSAAPNDAGVRALEALHLRLTGDWPGSLNAAQRAAALAPESPAMLAQLGAAYQRLGQLDDARTWYQRAQALAGGDPRYAELAEAVAQTEDAALEALLEALESGEASAP